MTLKNALVCPNCEGRKIWRIERLLSAHTTCRLQRRSLFAYLAGLLTAHARGDPVPRCSFERGTERLQKSAH